MSKENLIIQSSITGYGGTPATILAVYDADKDILVISAQAANFLPTKAKEDYLLIVNNDRLNYDHLFKPEYFKEAIQDYFSFDLGRSKDGRDKRLVFGAKAVGCNPTNSIQRLGMDQNCPVYEVSEGITNAQVATLAICHYVQHYGQVMNDIGDFFQELIKVQFQGPFEIR